MNKYITLNILKCVNCVTTQLGEKYQLYSQPNKKFPIYVSIGTHLKCTIL